MLKIVFTQRFIYPFFGVMSISALLKREGYDVELVMDVDSEKVIKEILRIQPDIVSIPVLVATGEYEWARHVTRGVKEQLPSCLTVLGGLKPTFFPEQAMEDDSVDAICRGEGERPFLELCRRFVAQKNFENVPGLWVRTDSGIMKNPIGPLIEDLDSLPFADRDLYQKYGYYDKVDAMDVLAGRGCVFNCSYCFNTSSKELAQGKGKFVRKHSVDYVIRELKELKAKYHPKSFTFMDELFTVSKHWVVEFCRKYREEIGLPFICSVTVDTVGEEVCEALADAGVRQVCLGLETGNELLRRNVLNKHFSNEEFLETAARLHRHGIPFLTSNMVGLPGETVDDAFETIELNRLARTDHLYFSVFQPYPGLNITKQLGQEKLMENSPFHSTFFKDTPLEQENISELMNLHKFFLLAVKFPFMRGAIRQLIKLPPNILFDLVFMGSFGLLQLKSFHRTPWQVIGAGFSNLKVFLTSRKSAVS